MRPSGKPVPPAAAWAGPDVTVIPERPAAPETGAGPEPAAGDRPPIALGRRDLAIGVAVVVLAIVVTAVVAFRAGSGTPAPAARPSAASPSPSGPPTIAQIYAAVAPSVVTIEAAEPGGTATGTGVVANATGAVLTAYHVVKGSTEVKLRFADGTAAAAKVAGFDAALDIATLAPSALPDVVVPAVLGNSGRLAVGNTVVAIGNQLGLTSSATAGVVSGLRRSATNPDGTRLTGLIQFDAAVNPGSSGGPLVNAKGETIGIVVALANPTPAGTFVGVGFAVPIAAALGAGGGGNRAPEQ